MAIVLGNKAIQQLRIGLKKLDRLGVPGQSAATVPRVSGVNRRRVVIVGTLDPAAGDTPSQGIAAGLRYDPDTRVIEATDERFELWNWDDSLTAEDGTFAKIEWLDGAWDIYWLGCGPKSGFTGLPEVPGE